MIMSYFCLRVVVRDMMVPSEKLNNNKKKTIKIKNKPCLRIAFGEETTHSALNVLHFSWWKDFEAELRNIYHFC